jgi:hypothetical protein
LAAGVAAAGVDGALLLLAPPALKRSRTAPRSTSRVHETSSGGASTAAAASNSSSSVLLGRSLITEVVA